MRWRDRIMKMMLQHELTWVNFASLNVRYWHKAEVRTAGAERPLMTQSGHQIKKKRRLSQPPSPVSKLLSRHYGVYQIGVV